MNILLQTANICGVLIIAGCNKSSRTEREAVSERGAGGDQTTEIPLTIGNSVVTPQHKEIESSEIGSNLDDAVRVLGSWDQVGDVMSDGKGQLYPFSNRSGYDYIVRIGQHGVINGVWRRSVADAHPSVTTKKANKAEMATPRKPSD